MNDGYMAPNIPSPLTNAINRLTLNYRLFSTPYRANMFRIPFFPSPVALSSALSLRLDTDPTDLAIFESTAKPKGLNRSRIFASRNEISVTLPEF